MQRKRIGGPLGKGDVEKGRRVKSLLDLAPRLRKVGCVPMFELKGDDLSGGWVEEVHSMLKPFDGVIAWHWSSKSTKKLGDPAEPVSEQLKSMAAEAKRLKETIGLASVTIHCAPAQAIEPSSDAGWERFNSPIGAEEILTHIERHIQPLQDLNQLCGGILQIETVDIANFRDSGFKLPNYLALQTGSWMDLIWLKKRTGVGITFDSEHHLCAGNVLLRRREMKDLPPLYEEDIPTSLSAQRLHQIAGYWLQKDHPPEATYPTDLAEFVQHARPRLFHFGAAVQAFDGDTICTHLPYDPNNQEQMNLLDWQLGWMMQDQNCLGGVTEVVGDSYVDDPANPGHNRFSPWSPRIKDDEEAKESAISTIIDRLEKIQ